MAPESRLNADDIDLEISLGWLSTKVNNFAASIMSKMTGGSSRYAKKSTRKQRKMAWKSTTKTPKAGMRGRLFISSRIHISAVHRWTSKSSTSEGDESTSTDYFIVANSVIHKIPGSKKQISQLCEILELDLQTKSPIHNLDFPERTLFK